MVITNLLQAKKIYLDANIIIYLLEQPLIYEKKLQQLQIIIDKNLSAPITSNLSILEVMVGYYKKKPEIASFVFKELQEENIFDFLPLNEVILLEAAKIRAITNFSLPDAIHIASALHYKADVFLTNDRQIKSNLLNIIQLTEL
jgi:predicted nucleic acid-binding protein